MRYASGEEAQVGDVVKYRHGGEHISGPVGRVDRNRIEYAEHRGWDRVTELVLVRRTHDPRCTNAGLHTIGSECVITPKMNINDALRSHAEQTALHTPWVSSPSPHRWVTLRSPQHEPAWTDEAGNPLPIPVMRDGTEWPARPPDTSHYESYQSFKHRDFKYRERHGRAPSVSPDLMVPNMAALYRAPDLDGPPRTLPEPGTLPVRAFDTHHADPVACTRCSAVTFRKGGLCDRCAK